MSGDRPLTTTEIAQYCHVSDRAVLKWIVAGKLKAYRTPGMHARVNVSDFLEFLETYKIPVPAELKKNIAKKKILVVDDDQELRHMMVRILTLGKKYEIESASDGFEAGTKFASFKPDLIVMDIRMPKMDGYSVLKQIRADEKNKDVKIIIVSGGDHQELDLAMKYGASDVLAKPFDNKQFVTKIEALLKV